MPKTGTQNEISGIYRSSCCGVERAIPKGHKFPPCTGGQFRCVGGNATWSLVRATQTER